MSTTLKPWQADVITTPPTIETEYARIWNISLLDKEIPKRLQGVGLWLIEAGWAHPLWHSYAMSLVNLAPSPGLPAPMLYIPNATHEMVLLALDPAQPRQPMIDDLNFQPLHPANFAAQMIMPDDGAAIANVERALLLIADGQLSPDTDFIRDWVRLFGDSMMLDRSTKH
jgi:hypothetical protein